MAEWTLQVLVDASRPENTFEEKNLPGNKQIYGSQRDFVGRHPAGQTVRSYFRSSLGVDFDDMAFDKVYYVGTQYDESGETTWYIPYRQSGPDGPLGRRHWAPVKIIRDTRAENSLKLQQSKQDAADAARQAQDQLELAKQQLAAAQAQAQIRQLQQQAAALSAADASPAYTPGVPAGSSTPGGATATPGAQAGLRTIEIYGMSGGQVVPLMQVVTQSPSGWVLISGAQVFASDNVADGFHLAGTPGTWNSYYAGHSPSEFGLDANTAVMFWDPNQRRGFAVPSSALQTVFGGSWRSVIYP